MQSFAARHYLLRAIYISWSSAVSEARGYLWLWWRRPVGHVGTIMARDQHAKHSCIRAVVHLESRRTLWYVCVASLPDRKKIGPL